MLTRLNERLDGRLVVCAGQPPGTSSLASLTTSEAYAFRYVPLRNYWLRGEAVHVQPFRPVFRSLGDPAVVLAEEAPRSVSLPPLLIYARRRGAGRVLWGHFSSNNRPFSPETHLLDRFRLELARRVEACVAYTDPIADLLRPYLPDEKIFVARNTLDMDRLFRLHDALAAEGKAAVRRRLHLPTDQPILAFLGRLIPSKGTTLLLDTFARLRAERPASLVVIGDGPDRAAMETRVAREGMADVHFLGALVDEAASAPFLFASDMLLIPGYLGLAVNHAFAFGLPVVSRRAPNGIRFHSPEIAYVEHGRTGMLCAWDDPDDLLNGVQRVLADQPSFSARSLAYARTHLTLDRMVDGLVAAIHYAERVGGSGGSRFGRITFWADHDPPLRGTAVDMGTAVHRTFRIPKSEIRIRSMVTILGRFPPPIDGQTMATDRLARLLADAVEVQRVNLSSGERALAESAVRFRLDRISHYLSVRRRLRTALGTHPDAAVFWTSISPAPLGHLRDLVTILPALRGRRSVYAVVHWGNFDTVFRSAATRPTARHLVRALRGVVFLNETLAERCAAWIPPEKRFVVPNTIDDEVRCHAGDLRRKADMRQTDRPLRLLFLSNMTPTKGYGDVLEAVRLLHERGVPIQADFAGRWETDQDAAAFAEAVHRYRLGDFITHHGGISDRTRVKALYLNADVFLLPTYYPTEAQPLSIIEALNAATPVITTRHAGIPDMVRDEKEALFVPPKSPESIADAVERLRDSAFWNQASRAARTRFETTFHPDVVRRHWLALLDAP